MTPKEKAEDLYQMYYECLWNQDEQSRIQNAKQGAIIAVDECLESTKQFIHYYTKEDDERYADVYLAMCLSVEYLNQVKQEIEKL